MSAAASICFEAGGLIAGLSWPVLLLLGGAEHFQLPALQGILHVLNIFHPLSYLSFGEEDGGLTLRWLAGLPPVVETLVPWCTALVAAIVAIPLWRRREA